MCALFPLFPVCELPLDAPIGHNQIGNGFVSTESLDDFHHFTFPGLPQLRLDGSPMFSGETGDGNNNPTVVKKLNHNASERDRRRKINSLYSTLRSLLPPSEQMRRLSIPTTVSRMLKYIPELEAQVEALVQKKEQILSSISRQDADRQQQSKKKLLEGFKSEPPFTVSVSKVSETEIVIQISTLGASSRTPPLSTILLGLEDDGLFLTDASSFESFGGRVFYNLNFQVERTYNLEAVVAVLNEKLLSLFGRRKLWLYFLFRDITKCLTQTLSLLPKQNIYSRFNVVFLFVQSKRTPAMPLFIDSK